ncbi:MAG: glycine cleavage system protein GcvH [Halobacteriales archaeon]|nr:glycine cleavage system protein GcvH [Halobacteriales archaeon]
MTFEVPDDLYYLESHEWAAIDGDTARIGITDYAQDELGDIVFVELPAVGDELEQEADFGVIESIKAVSDLYSPLSGTVTAVNEELESAPELVNDDPYNDGWMIEIELSDEGEVDALLDPSAYSDQIE